MIKSDAYQRNLEGPILYRVAQAGLRIIHSEKRRLKKGEVDELYREHKGKPFFEINRDFILSGPVGIFIIEGEGNVARRLREVVGSKDPDLAEKGTIRGDYGINREHIERNLVHASSDQAAARREVALFIHLPENPGLDRG